MTHVVEPIKRFAAGIFDGPHATPAPADDGPVFLGIKNVTAKGRLDLSDVRHVSAHQYPQWTRRVTPQEDDIVFSYEATLHLYARIPAGFEGCLGRRIALVRPNLSRVDPKFLLYYFLSPGWRAKMDAITITGATVNRIPLTTFPDTEVSFPDLPEQKAIADLLSAYDDLIENSRRRIALLEEAARLLYREWFVHLRFPGHEHVQVVNGVPAGWERRLLGACVTFHSGGTPSKAKARFWEGDVPWLSSGELTSMRITTSTRFVTDEAVQAGSRYAEVGTILGVVRGMSLAKEFRIGVVGKRVCFNQDLKALVPDRGIESLYLFHALDAQRERIRQFAGQASHGTKKLETAVLEAVEIPVPPPALRQQFAEYASPLHRQMDVLTEQTRRLECARDLLLPRLMSGEIAV